MDEENVQRIASRINSELEPQLRSLISIAQSLLDLIVELSSAAPSTTPAPEEEGEVSESHAVAEEKESS